MFQVKRVCAKAASYDKERDDWFDIYMASFSLVTMLILWVWTDTDVMCSLTRLIQSRMLKITPYRSLQFRSILLISVCEFLTLPRGGGARCVPPQPMICWLASAVRKWASLGELHRPTYLCFHATYFDRRLKCACALLSMVNYSVTSVPEASGDGGEFFCVRQEELSYGKKIKDSLFPW